MQVVVYYDDQQTYYGFKPDHWFKVGENLRTGEEDFKTHFGNPTSLERDLLVISASIFATDLIAKRGMREEVTRDLSISIPVVNFHAMENQKIALERILHFLSHDNWNLTFTPLPGIQEPYETVELNNGKTLLFSGGLDSFAAAVDLIDEFGSENILLASHVTGNTFTIRSQSRLHTYLEETYNSPISRISMRTGGKTTENLEFTDDPEISQRTRSLTFLTIAALAARRRGMAEIVMIAENGQMAIHLPLSAGRIGAFSTHTAHPKFVNDISIFFSSILQHPIRIENPYLYKTKAQVVETLCKNHSSAIALSSSCWKSWRVGGQHCGECIPCYIRRIALEYHGISVDTWKRNIFQEDIGLLDHKDDGKRNIMELAQFASDFRSLPEFELDMTYCELFSSDFNRNQAVAMYRNFATEAAEVFSHYPNLTPFF